MNFLQLPSHLIEILTTGDRRKESEGTERQTGKRTKGQRGKGKLTAEGAPRLRWDRQERGEMQEKIDDGRGRRDEGQRLRDESCWFSVVDKVNPKF